MRSYKGQMMDDGEIVREYKASKNPSGQIEILSQLACISKNDVRRILNANGFNIPIWGRGRKNEEKLTTAKAEKEKTNIMERKKKANPIPEEKMSEEQKEFLEDCKSKVDSGTITEEPPAELTREENDYRHTREVKQLEDENTKLKYELQKMRIELDEATRKSGNFVEFVNSIQETIMIMDMEPEKLLKLRHKIDELYFKAIISKKYGKQVL